MGWGTELEPSSTRRCCGAASSSIQNRRRQGSVLSRGLPRSPGYLIRQAGEALLQRLLHPGLHRLRLRQRSVVLWGKNLPTTFSRNSSVTPRNAQLSRTSGKQEQLQWIPNSPIESQCRHVICTRLPTLAAGPWPPRRRWRKRRLAGFPSFVATSPGTGLSTLAALGVLTPGSCSCTPTSPPPLFPQGGTTGAILLEKSKISTPSLTSPPSPDCPSPPKKHTHFRVTPTAFQSC